MRGRVKASARPSVVLASRYAGLEFDLCARRGGTQAKGGGVAFLSSGIRVVGVAGFVPHQLGARWRLDLEA